MKLETWEPLETKYKPQVIALAERIANDIREDAAQEENGWKVSEVSDFTDSDLAVFFLVECEGREPIDLTFRLLDAKEWDGEENGTSFALDVVAEGGRIVGRLQPFNYSSRVWVDPKDAGAVEERWTLFRDALDANDIIASIESYWNEN